MQKKWQVVLSRRMAKRIDSNLKKKLLPQHVVAALKALMQEIECFGPTLGSNKKHWPNFGSLRGRELYHCHLKRGRPTYVACWRVEDRRVKIVEVYYVGTHEKAPY